MKPQERLLLLTLVLVQFVHIVDFMIVMPLGPELSRVFGLTAQQFGGMVSAYSISAAVMSLVASSFIDRLERKRAYLLAFTGFLLGTALCGIAPSYGVLVGARILAGAFGGILNALAYAIIGDTFPPERRGSANGWLMLAFSFASVMGVPLGLWFSNAMGWHAPFLLLAGLGLAVMLMGVISIPTCYPKTESRSPLTVVRKVLATPNQQMALGLMFFMVVGQFAVIPYISNYLVFNLAYPETLLPVVYLFGGTASVIVSPLTGRLTDRFGARGIFTIGAVLVLVPILLLTDMPTPAQWAIWSVTTLFFIFAGMRMVPAMTLITGAARPENRAGFMSLNTFVQQLGAGAGSFIGGAILTEAADHTYQHYEWVGYWAVLCSILAVWLGRRIRVVA